MLFLCVCLQRSWFLIASLERLWIMIASFFSEFRLRYSFSSKRKSVQKVCLDFLVSHHHPYSGEKSRHIFAVDLRFEEKDNVATLEKI